MLRPKYTPWSVLDEGPGRLSCPKLQRVNYERIITTDIYPYPKDMSEEVLDKLEWTATRAVKEYEASGRALWT